MQNKRGTVSEDNAEKLINDLTEKLNSQNKLISDLRKKESEFLALKEVCPTGQAEYDYSSGEWIVSDLFLRLLDLDLPKYDLTLIDVLANLDDVLNYNTVQLFEKALIQKQPFDLTFYLNPDTEDSLIVLKAKPFVDPFIKSLKYICIITRIDASEIAADNKGNQFRLTGESLNQLPMAYFRVDKNCNIIHVNNTWEEYHGYSHEQVRGKSAGCHLPEYAKDEIENSIKAALHGETIYKDYSLLDVDKSIRYYATVVFPVYDGSGRITGAEGFSQDVTKLKAAEENLKIKEEKYDIINQNVPVVVYSREAGWSFKVLFVSGQIKTLTEFDLDEFFSNPSAWQNIIYDDDSKYFEKKIEEQIQNDSQLNIEYRIITKSGIVKWVRDASTPIKNDEGRTIKINGFIEDISDRKNAERALKLSEKKFRSIFEESRDCIYLTTGSGKFIDINSAGLNLTGYSKEEILTLNAEHLYVDIADRFRFQRILEKENYVKDFEFKLRKKNGKIRDCILTSSASKNDSGEIKGYQGIIRDVTEKKKAERELITAKEEAEKADRIKTEFLAQMSHEIRTPINTILSFSSLISDELSEVLSEPAQEYFSVLDRAGIRIIRTIDLILNMSEIQSGSYKYKLDIINLASILFDLYAEYKSHAASKGLNLIMNLEQSEISIKGDEYSVTQIISNLIDNAIKYTETGYIKIYVDLSNGKTRLIIEDTGIGISSRYVPHLFDAFTQEEQGYTRKFEGSGLGLALVKKYCDINRAEISVESSKGEGSRFIINFRR